MKKHPRSKFYSKYVSSQGAAFGYSRLSFYRIRTLFDQTGLEALVPKRRGPKDAHKLSEEIMLFIEQAISKDKTLRARRLKPMIEIEFGVEVHPRSIERWRH